MKSLFARSPIRVRLGLPVLAIAAAALLAGCGARKDGAGGEIAAKVNKDEISAGLVNFLLAQQRGVKPEQADAAGRQILERLVDQQLAVRKALDQKLEAEPGVQLAMEVARREVLSRAYAERMGEAAPKPTPEEIRKYYNEQPALFSERRIYNLQEIGVEARPEQFAEIRERLEASKSTTEFVDYLKGAGLRFSGNQAVRAAEQLPLKMLEGISRMKDGQAMIVPTATGAQVIVLVSSRPQPVSEEQAKAAIEQHLLGERRRKLVEDDMKTMRASAKIEYQGKFAAAPSATGSSGGVSMPAPPASGLTSADINKGPATK